MCLCFHDYNHYHYYYYCHHYCCRYCCCYQYYYHHHHVIVIITIIIIILGIFNHQCMWTYYYKIRWDFAMMWQIAAFKYIFSWYLHPGIYSSMEYSITWRHKLCRAYTLDALASRPVACPRLILNALLISAEQPWYYHLDHWLLRHKLRYLKPHRCLGKMRWILSWGHWWKFLHFPTVIVIACRQGCARRSRNSPYQSQLPD